MTHQISEGDVFGRLIVTGEAPRSNGGGHRRWISRCECGNTTTTKATKLVSGLTQSCGCLGREKGSENLKSGKRSNWLKEITKLRKIAADDRYSNELIGIRFRELMS